MIIGSVGKWVSGKKSSTWPFVPLNSDYGMKVYIQEKTSLAHNFKDQFRPYNHMIIYIYSIKYYIQNIHMDYTTYINCVYIYIYSYPTCF